MDTVAKCACPTGQAVLKHDSETGELVAQMYAHPKDRPDRKHRTGMRLQQFLEIYEHAAAGEKDWRVEIELPDKLKKKAQAAALTEVIFDNEEGQASGRPELPFDKSRPY